MGAKQSKRSVDISGKEAEGGGGGGEVAAAGAGCEGRLEQIADVDALKPQSNGEPHIQQEQTEKEKELDSGTPENEKDATTEKENKEQNDKETAPVTNGDTEEKMENGDSTPTPEDGKKPKKEKVKKKWSLRSISFSRKDKPKQEKKQKEEEPKTNGEPEKVPEETAEATPESVSNEVVEEAKAPAETKEETTPETPVTEPLTNGTSTPESVKAETPATEEAAPVSSPERTESTQPEQLPVNGLTLEEPKIDNVEVEKTEDVKVEPTAVEPVETAPAPEIPVKEVCVEQMPLLESTPPPLPANPPPSSVVSFAATTMAPELTTDASLVNTPDTANTTLTALQTTEKVSDDKINEMSVNDIVETNEFVPSLKETVEEKCSETEIEQIVVKCDPAPAIDVMLPANDLTTEVETVSSVDDIVKINEPELTIAAANDTQTVLVENITPLKNIENVDAVITVDVLPDCPSINELKDTDMSEVEELVESKTSIEELPPNEPQEIECEIDSEIIDIPLPEIDTETIVCDNDLPLPPPPPSVQDDDLVPENVDVMEMTESKVDETETPEIMQTIESKNEVIESIVKLAETPEKAIETEELSENKIDGTLESKIEAVENLETNVEVPENPIQKTVLADSTLSQETIAIKKNEIVDENEVINYENAENKTEVVSEVVKEHFECNGDDNEHEVKLVNVTRNGPSALVAGEDMEPAPLSESAAEPPPPPANLCEEHAPQEVLPVCDKLSELIPEVPDVPELKTETLQETMSDVAVAN